MERHLGGLWRTIAGLLFVTPLECARPNLLFQATLQNPTADKKILSTTKTSRSKLPARRAASNAASAPLSTATTAFLLTYQDRGATYDIRGFEPRTSRRGSPVYLFMPGNMEVVSEGSMVMRFAEEMASRGYVAAVAEMPGMWSLRNIPNRTRELGMEAANREISLRCNGTNTSLMAIAQRVFTHPNGLLPSLCRHPTADCDAGLALHGHSLGGFYATLATHFATVGALLVYAAGSVVPGGASCCGIFSNDESCCTPDAAGGWRAVGGDPLECLRYESTSTAIPQSRVRVIIAADDALYGDDACPAPPCPGSSINAISQCQMATGYNCGNATSCLQADGSGYFVPAANETRGHTFPYDEDMTELHPLFIETDAPWGLRASMDWIAATAATRTEARGRYRG